MAGPAPRVVSAPGVLGAQATPDLTHDGAIRGGAPVVIAAVVVAALLGGALVAEDRPPGYTRGELAAIARLDGQAAAYGLVVLHRSSRADTARWEAQAAFHERVVQARAERARAGALPADRHRALPRGAIGRGRPRDAGAA